GLPFFSMECVDRGTLAQQLDGTPLSPDQAGRVVEVVARAVAAAHQAGGVHRDLKPANVLLADGDPAPGVPLGGGPTGPASYQPKVTDFGLAKRLDAVGAGHTESGAVVGTPSYLAPEQATGKRDEVGPLSDVWSLGAILYECLTGRPPFKAATTLDTLQQV